MCRAVATATVIPHTGSSASAAVAVVVVVTDFLIGVLSALVIYGAVFKFLDKGGEVSTPQAKEMPEPQQTNESLTSKNAA